MTKWVIIFYWLVAGTAVFMLAIDDEDDHRVQKGYFLPAMIVGGIALPAVLLIKLLKKLKLVSK